MLCVNQAQRWTASQLLKHPWINTHDDVLATRNLNGTITTMKKVFPHFPTTFLFILIFVIVNSLTHAGNSEQQLMPSLQ